MAEFLVACTPLHGHVTPLLAVSSALAARGHRVTVCTGARFADAVAAAGCAHRALPAEADYDDRSMLRATGGRIGRVNADIAELVAAPLAAQHHAVGRLVDELRPQAVVVDSSFLGGVTWRLAGTSGVPLVVVNVTFLSLRAPGVPPAGVGMAPLRGPAGAVRDAAVRAVTDRVLVRPGLAALDAATRRVLGVSVPGLLFDGPGMGDLLLACTVPGFEHPTAALPDHVRFVGPVVAPPPAFEPPSWWGDLDGHRPVVHVTQGTMDTADPGKLIAPTVQALADDDVTVVVTTGGGPARRVEAALGDAVPANAHVATYLPYAHLLPRVDAMVTNGGFGGVQQALAAGVPLVCAGDGEDKPEVAARVARSGAGIALHRGRPTARQVRRAVHALLGDGRYRAGAGALAAAMARTGGAEAAADEIEALRTRRAAP